MDAKTITTINWLACKFFLKKEITGILTTTVSLLKGNPWDVVNSSLTHLTFSNGCIFWKCYTISIILKTQKKNSVEETSSKCHWVQCIQILKHSVLALYFKTIQLNRDRYGSEEQSSPDDRCSGLISTLAARMSKCPLIRHLNPNCPLKT